LKYGYVGKNVVKIKKSPKTLDLLDFMAETRGAIQAFQPISSSISNSLVGHYPIG
jgi:hypothetical protein